MRIETIHGRHLLCGGLIPDDMVKPGQTWAPADGSNHTVFVEAVRGDYGDWVTYSWIENGLPKENTKSNFAFQCRYCPVLDIPKVPKELREHD